MPKCARPACESGLDAEYSFDLDGFPGDSLEPEAVIKYCAPCVALNITQGWFSRAEVDSLAKL